MSPKIYKTFTVVLLILFVSCSEDDTPDTPTVKEFKILPIGDSRVQGNSPIHESYRYELWKNFIDFDWSVDLIGPEIDNSTYPEYNELEFDINHAAVSGYTTLNVLRTIEETLLEIDTPDIVLLGIGGNDLVQTGDYERAISNINEIIDILQTNNPDVTIFLEQIAPAKTTTFRFQGLLEIFNNGIADVAISKTTTTSEVVAVDMASGWEDILLADNVHYNGLGAKVIADRYYDAIDEHVEQ